MIPPNKLTAKDARKVAGSVREPWQADAPYRAWGETKPIFWDTWRKVYATGEGRVALFKIQLGHWGKASDEEEDL